MKSLAELQAIREKTLNRINLRKEDEAEATRVVIGMATCGIAAGARPVMLAFMDEISKRAKTLMLHALPMAYLWAGT